MNSRIVMTGAGVICPVGAGIEDFEQKLFGGCSGIGPSEMFGADATTAEVRAFTPQTWLGSKGIRVLDRAARLLAVASQMTLSATGLQQPENAEGDPNLGMVCGTMFGSVHSITAFDWSGQTEGVKYVNPMEFPNTVINSPAGQAAIKFKLRGVNSTISAGLASGLFAIHYASEFLKFGRANALLAGGVEELCEESFVSFRKAGVTSATGKSKPFQTDRDGIVLGEGSSLLMLERMESALERGAKPLAEICGFGSAHDAHDIRSFAVRGEGAAWAIEQALAASGIGAEEIGCIIAGASGSVAGDLMESHALKRVFGQRIAEVPVGAPKAAFGEAMGASGALNTLAGAFALIRGEAPPTAGFVSSDLGLRLSPQPQPCAGEYALVNCFGCDGNNASLVLRRIHS